METPGFPVLIHVFTIPLTLAVGFVLGWVVHGIAAAAPPPRSPVRPEKQNDEDGV